MEGSDNPANGLFTHINGRLDVFETMIDAAQAFRMTNEEIASTGKVVVIFVDQALLRRAVKVYHDVAAEDKVELIAERPIGEEIQMPERDHSP